MQLFDAGDCITKIRNRIKSLDLLMGGSGSVHCLLADQYGNKIFEEYAYPYSKDKMHRMFSITKSFTALAIGFLIDEGKLSLDDRIVTFFPEYEPEGGFHPYLLNMTIRDMLSMRTCHTSTTYKFHVNRNWVESFFVTEPSHRSGKVFNYDTSSSHTLAALVKKLSGLGILDYLRTRIPEEYLFSKDAYVIKDPFGDEIGGSGLMCYPEDVLKVARFVMNELLEADSTESFDEGKRDSGSGAKSAFCKNDPDAKVVSFRDFLKEAVSFKTPNVQTGQVTEERQGYGFSFWRTRGGFCMFGMGGQYALFYPQYDLIIVTCADLQNIKGGTQPLLDIIHDTLLEMAPDFEKYENSIYKYLDVKNVYSDFDYTYNISGKTKFDSFHIVYKDNKGRLCITQKSADNLTCYDIPFDMSKESGGKLPLIDPDTGRQLSDTSIDVPFVSKARWISEDTLYLELDLVGEEVGSIHITMNISDENLTVQMKKIVEARFEDFQGFLEGKRGK